MSEKAKLRYADPNERLKTSLSVKGTKDHRGERNPMFGRVQSEETRRKISEAKRARNKEMTNASVVRKYSSELEAAAILGYEVGPFVEQSTSNNRVNSGNVQTGQS